MKSGNNLLTTILLVLGCLSLSPLAQAVVPAPDGGYPGGNTAEGQNALLSLTTGGYNTAIGYLSLRSDTTGSFNTAIGAGTLLANTADNNTATGAGALLRNTTGNANTANGTFALFSNTTGFANTAIGPSALLHNTTGSLNTAIGLNALSNNTTGSGNIALGVNAGSGVVGADNVVAIGTAGDNVSNTTWIGNIFGCQTAGCCPGCLNAVYVTANGQLFNPFSSERFNKNIATMEKASEAILSLRPVTFHYKTDENNTPQFGLIAEEVAKVNPALVLPDKEGKPYTVCYEAVNAMLLNEFLKEHRKVEEQSREILEQRATITELKKAMETVIARVDERASQIQKVSDQLAAKNSSGSRLNVSKFTTGRIRHGGAAPQIVLNNQ